jgi:hypothetical protein
MGIKNNAVVKRVGVTVSMALIALLVLAGAPADTTVTATGTPVELVGLSASMKPQPPQLSEDEKRAIADKEAGRPYDQRAYNSARQKQIKAEKFNQDRNKQKRRK